MSVKTLMTVEEFAGMETAETEDYELVEGELIPLASANPLHARIRHNVDRRIGNYLEDNPLGVVLCEVDCRLSKDTVRRPDIAIFVEENLKRLDLDVIPIPFSPDIAVEILSPSERALDVNSKTLEYLNAGSREVWCFDPRNGEIFVQTNAGIRLLRGEDRLESPLLPGFSFPASVLLAGF